MDDFFRGAECRGTGLIEVMLTLVIMTIGLLGLASLQGLTTHRAQGALLRSLAIGQANDIIDRMRANRDAVSATGYLQTPIPALSHPDCYRTSCTPDQLATFDLVAWREKNAVLLPRGSGSISNPENNVIRVHMKWEHARKNPADTKSFQVDVAQR